MTGIGRIPIAKVPADQTVDGSPPDKKEEPVTAQNTDENLKELRNTFLASHVEAAVKPPRKIILLMPALFLLFFTVIGIWSWFAELDIVVRAQGSVLPSARVKLVQAADTGVIQAIYVREGDQVAKGDPVIELDPTETDAEKDKLLYEVSAARIEVARLTAMTEATIRRIAGKPAHPREYFTLPPSQDDQAQTLVDEAAMLLEAEWRKLSDDRRSARQEIRRAEAGAQALTAELAKINAIIPIEQERTAALKILMDKKLTARSEYLTQKRILTEAELQVDVLLQSLEEAQAAVGLAQQTYRSLLTGFDARVQAELKDARAKLAARSQELKKAREWQQRRVLTAPTDGTVADLAVHTVGGVVQPAQALMKIVPLEDRLEIEAVVENRDVGFVKVGQRVEVKVDAFNYLRYGTIKGNILSISADAGTTAPGQTPAPGAAVAASDSAAGPAKYRARIALDLDHVMVEGNPVRLTPGMTTTTDIKTGKRRAIEFLLNPILRYKAESLRER